MPSSNFDRGNLVDWTTEFSGLIVKVTFKAVVKRGKGNNSKPRKIDPIKLIPSFKNSTSMTFRKD